MSLRFGPDSTHSGETVHLLGAMLTAALALLPLTAPPPAAVSEDRKAKGLERAVGADRRRIGRHAGEG